MSSNIVLVTGFGPFAKQTINASWEAVKLLDGTEIDNTVIVTKEIPVTYKFTDENIPELWKTYLPKLVVHVGVMQNIESKCIRIETQANRCNYIKFDCEGAAHPTTEACSSCDGDDCISTGLKIEEICKYISERTSIDVKVSNDAGRYLCEYIYYKSLNIDKSKCLFIHVPILGNPYSKEELSDVILLIIKGALQQLGK